VYERLKIARSTYYQEAKPKPDQSDLDHTILTIFHLNHAAYGARKMKKALKFVHSSNFDSLQQLRRELV
jgi:hypothetical protein